MRSQKGKNSEPDKYHKDKTQEKSQRATHDALSFGDCTAAWQKSALTMPCKWGPLSFTSFPHCTLEWYEKKRAMLLWMAIFQQTPLNWPRSEMGRRFWSHQPDGSILPPQIHYIIPLLKGLYSEVSWVPFALVPRASFLPASSIR